jgi:hypothetical protein
VDDAVFHGVPKPDSAVLMITDYLSYAFLTQPVLKASI